MTRFAVVLLPLLFACAPVQPEPAPLPTPIPVAAPVAVASPGLMGDYTMTLADEDLPPTAPPQMRGSLVGDWVFAFHGGNHFIATQDGTQVVQGPYEVRGNQIVFPVGGTGRYACSVPGTYTWQISNGQLTLTPVQDACQGRVVVLSSRPLVRRP